MASRCIPQIYDPGLRSEEVYQWQTFDDWGRGSYICGIYHISHGSYDMYYRNITLGCRAGYLTMKTTYNYVLYLFVNSSTWNGVPVHWGNHSVPRDWWIQISASDTQTKEEIMPL